MTEFSLDPDARYAKTHEWIRVDDGVAIIGISDYAQDSLSDVVYVELPEEGMEVSAGQSVAVVESVKAAEDIYAPISGAIVAVNHDLETTPELVNDKPYESWFFKMSTTDALDEELGQLMSGSDYDAFVESIA